MAIANTMTNTGLAKLTRDVVGWPQFYSALNAELRQAEFDHIAVRRLDDTARMHVRQVIDDVPLLVAYQVVAARHLVHAAVRQTWHAWPIEHALRYDTTTLADLAAAQEGPWVISWRAPDNLSLARAITTCLMTRAGETRGVRVELEPMSAQRLIARRAIIADIERRRRALNKPGWTGWKNPVAGACLLCGRPLRDPESVFRGIGPDCWETFRGAGLTLDLRETRTDISPERWASALTMQTFRALLVDDLHQDLR